MAAWALALVVLTTIIRLPALFHPAPIDDEAPYTVVANEIVEGGRPYVDAVDRKPPLLFWTYAAIAIATGKCNWIALHTVGLLWTLATLAGLFVAGRRLYDAQTGLAAALLYTIYLPWGTWKNLAFNGEMLMNLPLAWAWALGLDPHPRNRFRPELLVVGALLACAFLLKQPAAIAAVPMGLYLLSPAYRARHGYRLIDGTMQAGLLTAGFAATLGGVAAVLHAQGILYEAFYWTILDHDVPVVFWMRGVLHTLAFLIACLPLWVGAAVVVRDRELWATQRAERTALLGWLVTSAIGAAASGRFYPHYYIQLVLPLSLLAAPLFASLARDRTPAHRSRLKWSAGWLAATVFVFAWLHWRGLAGLGGASAAGRYIATHAAPDDRIFVWGQAEEIYLDAARRPASRYIATFPLTGYVFGGDLPPGYETRSRILPSAWPNLEQDFARHPPAYIVDVQSDPSVRYPIEQFPVLARLIHDQYHLVARTDEGPIYERNSRRTGTSNGR